MSSPIEHPSKSWAPVRPSADCTRIIPARPLAEDALAHHLLTGGLQALKKDRLGGAVNLFEAVLAAPTRNRWIYHAMAAYHLALLKGGPGGQPGLRLLEQALNANCMFPDALRAGMAHAPGMTESVIRRATGLASLNARDFVAIMECGVWKDLNLFRDSDDAYRGKRVLDYGARTGFHALAFLAAGASFYCGVDRAPKAFRLKRLKNHLAINHPMTEVGFSMEELAGRHPDRLLVKRKHREEDAIGFDLIALFAVSEHLDDFDGVMGKLSRLLRPDGQIVIAHHNFHSWNGHHDAPKSASQMEQMTRDGQPVPLADWRFFDAEIVNTFLNRLSIRQIRSLLERRFQLAQWTVEFSRLEQGLERFSPAILAEHPGMTPDDLLIQRVLIRLRRKPSLWNALRRAWRGSFFE